MNGEHLLTLKCHDTFRCHFVPVSKGHT